MKMNKYIPIILLVVLSFSFGINKSFADDNQVWESCRAGIPSCSIRWNYTMGYKFTPQTDGQITKLCGYFSGTKPVRLYNSSYSIIASTNVSSSNNWSCSNISPVDVSNGSVYYVVTNVGGIGGCYTSNENFPKTCGDILINATVYQSPSGSFNSSHLETGLNMYGLVDVVFLKPLPIGCNSNIDCDDSNPCTDDICNNPGQPGSTCSNNNKINGTDCGNCQECQSGICTNMCSGAESSCECVDDACVDCSDYYGTGCGYSGKCNCGSLQTPNWTCNSGSCSCTCSDNLINCSTCEDHDVWNWAWTGDANDKEGIGWISFSCVNQGEPINYGVDIETNGNLIGYAYFDMNDTNTASEEVGWIDFDPDLSERPGGPNYTARIDTDGSLCGEIGRVCGWARAVNTDSSWDGWLRFNENINHSISNYKVVLDDSVSPSVISGYAWGGNVLGWVKINARTNFTLTNPPVVSDLRQEGNTDYCTSVQKRGYLSFSWLYNGDYPQEEYELEISNNLGVLANITDSQTVSPNNRGSSGLTIIPEPVYDNYEIGYNDTYYLRVKAKDELDVWSDWSNTLNIPIDSHAYPYPDFEWTPTSPAVEETVYMVNNSICYNMSNNPVNCASYNWTIPGDAIYVDSTSSSSYEPHIQFTSTGDNNVVLLARDSTGYSCTKEDIVGIKLPFPDWIEINPE